MDIIPNMMVQTFLKWQAMKTVSPLLHIIINTVWGSAKLKTLEKILEAVP